MSVYLSVCLPLSPPTSPSLSSQFVGRRRFCMRRTVHRAGSGHVPLPFSLQFRAPGRCGLQGQEPEGKGKCLGGSQRWREPSGQHCPHPLYQQALHPFPHRRPRLSTHEDLFRGKRSQGPKQGGSLSHKLTPQPPGFSVCKRLPSLWSPLRLRRIVEGGRVERILSGGNRGSEK